MTTVEVVEVKAPQCACSHCETARARAIQDRITALKSANFCLGYAWREDGDMGYVSSYRITGEYSGGHRLLTVTEGTHASYGEPYVSFDSVATTECSYGQSSTVNQSNYRSIKRDFPQYPWVDTSYTNVNALGIFVADLDDEMTGVLVGLKEQYPVYDESDLSELESDEIGESWSQYVRSDIWREMSEYCRTLIWDDLGEDTVTDLFWEAVSNDVFGSYPEHAGVEVLWGDMKERAADFREVLIKAYAAKRWPVMHGPIDKAAILTPPAIDSLMNSGASE